MDAIYANRVHVFDGGFGFLLEKLGYNVNAHEMWSAGANIERPDLVRQAHKLFIEAGASIISTNTYHISVRKMMEIGYSREAAEAVIEGCVENARCAIAESSNPKTHLVGSIGPYGIVLRDASEHTGAYTKASDFNPQIIVDHYLEVAKPLLKAGVRYLLFETIPSVVEVECLGKVLEQLDGDFQAWIVASCQDGVRTRSGDSFAEFVRLASTFPRTGCIGVNCTSPIYISELMKTASSVLLESNRQLPLIVYPNSGEDYNLETRGFEGHHQIEMIVCLIPTWIDFGVRIIGWMLQDHA